MKPSLHGLYAITDSQLLQGKFSASVEQALQGGVRILQYRDKTSDSATRLQQAETLKALCLQHGARLIINDDIELAARVDADGVHLGKNDANIHKARKTLGEGKIIGVSCYNQLELAIQAQQQGANYVAFGRFFTSQTKPDAVSAPLDIISQAKQVLDIPVCCIGGINLDNAAQLILQGADMLAVIHAIFASDNIKQAAQQIAQQFTG